MSEKRLMFDNSLECFRSGAVLDLRVRIAVDLLTHSPLLGAEETPAKLAEIALDTATALIDLAEERGLVEALDSPAGQARLKAHIDRQVWFQTEVAKEQRRAQEEAARIPQAVAGAFRKPS